MPADSSTPRNDSDLTPNRTITLLEGHIAGDRQATAELLPLVYDRLRKLAARCHEKEIVLIVTTFPVREKLLALAEPGSFEYFTSSVRRACEEAGVAYYDLNTLGFNDDGNFYDLDHLEPAAGARMSRQIARDWLLPHLR